jgi:hypothetical protein
MSVASHDLFNMKLRTCIDTGIKGNEEAHYHDWLVSIEVRNLVDGNHPKAPGSFHAAHSSSRFCSMIAFALR